MDQKVYEGQIMPTDEIRAHNRVVLSALQRDCPEFVTWYARLARRGGNLIDAAVIDIPRDDSAATGHAYQVTIFTSEYQYTIRVRAGSRPNDLGYLGVTAACRKTRAGEDWVRGNDLADGPYCEETWNCIVHDIVAHELVRLGKL